MTITNIIQDMIGAIQNSIRIFKNEVFIRRHCSTNVFFLSLPKEILEKLTPPQERRDIYLNDGRRREA